MYRFVDRALLNWLNRRSLGPALKSRRSEASLPLNRFPSTCDLLTLIASSKNASSRLNSPAGGAPKGAPPLQPSLFSAFIWSMSVCSTPNKCAKRFDRATAALESKPFGSRLLGQRYCAKLEKPDSEKPPVT